MPATTPTTIRLPQTTTQTALPADSHADVRGQALRLDVSEEPIAAGIDELDVTAVPITPTVVTVEGA